MHCNNIKQNAVVPHYNGLDGKQEKTQDIRKRDSFINSVNLLLFNYSTDLKVMKDDNFRVNILCIYVVCIY